MEKQYPYGKIYGMGLLTYPELFSLSNTVYRLAGIHLLFHLPLSTQTFHINAVCTEQVQCMFLMLIKLTPGLIFGVMHYSAKKAYYFFMKGDRELLSIETQNLLLATGTKTC